MPNKFASDQNINLNQYILLNKSTSNFSYQNIHLNE